ncbi:hypothetical protein HMPREF0043_00666 [Actinobaculum sp. oral taxon 183 str. F0552]|nr:hypothetical protein HMPREF0043_00666 [Actinobaculum sp. oral taxon 183 str. F0552]
MEGDGLDARRCCGPRRRTAAGRRGIRPSSPGARKRTRSSMGFANGCAGSDWQFLSGGLPAG